ncbi:SH3 domain containing protein [Ceratobasidium theobromae]|uniref:SH3 domain containing protein n=1 Tax=Ceratobasidium theobromae TaxID=1582974 RepID=A0A5N5QV72_9AGAM|nr:SH3 domain containing protein [Ceratobasidium theobromae]
MPVLRRQILSLISEELQSRISTASTDLLGPTQVQVPAPVLTTATPTLPGTTAVLPNAPIASTSTVILQTSTSSTALTTSTTTSTTTTSETSTTQAVTSSVLSSSSSISSLVPTTTTASTPRVVQTTSRVVVTPSASATGAASGSGSNSQDSGDMSGGIRALIIVGALLAALLAGAFIYRRVQVHRRAKRRGNNFGPGSFPDNSQFPFSSVSEPDLKGAQPISDVHQNSVAPLNDKPLPSIVPDYPLNVEPAYGQPMYGDNGFSGTYPGVGAAAGYGYGQPVRAPSPAQSQATWRSAAPTFVSAAPGVPVNGLYPAPYQKAPSPAPSLPAPAPAPVSTMKRVVQTFQPTLPDELDIREGDWVTVVHAYDDGWGLCECDGRRGVVPLECLDPGKPDLRASRRFSSLSTARQ